MMITLNLNNLSGDAVKFVCSKSSSGPTQWMANEIYLDTESTI